MTFYSTKVPKDWLVCYHGDHWGTGNFSWDMTGRWCLFPHPGFEKLKVDLKHNLLQISLLANVQQYALHLCISDTSLGVSAGGCC